MEHTENNQSVKIAVIGLGYVGLPLARLFATKYPVVGFDINPKRIAELKAGTDLTLEVEDSLLRAVLVSENPLASRASATSGPVAPSSHHAAAGLYCSTQIEDIADATIYIVTVPTPVDKNNRPDLMPLIKASETVGKVLRKGDTVIYESTVYPGVTEEECIPVLAACSGLVYNTDFFAGYSPERINPGDREKTIENIMKVTSGSTPETGKRVDELYQSIILAGTHLAPTIKVAEASKVIENAQRDINIAFINELAKIFSLMDIDTHEVLKAARTKWNFLPFKPGLVGGHCIGVDPFYLAQKAQEIGYYSELILAARRLNDSMGAFIANRIIKLMINTDLRVNGSDLLILGITFKENCPDIRNTKVVDVIRSLEEYNINITVYDPWANPADVLHEYGLTSHKNLPVIAGNEADRNDTPTSPSVIAGNEAQRNDGATSFAQQKHSSDTPHPTSDTRYDAIVLAVAHEEFLHLDLEPFKKENAVVFDVKGMLKNPDARL